MVLSGKMRCNVCSRLLTTRNVKDDRCVCGSSAWFVSKVTVFEWLRFVLRIDRDSDLKLNLSQKPIAGHADLMDKAWPKKPLQEVVSNVVSTR